jgi:single-stranded DNA-binding protein
MNRCMFAGNLARDPFVSDANEQGNVRVAMTVACPSYFKKNDDGKMEEVAKFIPITVFGASSEFARHLKKGTAVIVDSAQVGQRKVGDGSDAKYMTDISCSASNVRLIGSRRQENGNENPSDSTSQESDAPASTPDQIPF